MFTVVVSNYLCNHRAWFWNVSRTWCIEPRNQPLQKDSSENDTATNPQNHQKPKKIMDQLDQPQKDQQTQKRSHPTHHLWDLWVFVGFPVFRKIVSVLPCPSSGKSTCFSGSDAASMVTACRSWRSESGAPGKGSGFKGNTANMFVAEISYLYVCFDCHECSWSS